MKEKTDSAGPKKELKISAIKQGIVLDHIPSACTLKVLKILRLKDISDIVSVAFHLPSKSIGKKGIIKVAGKSLSKKEIAKVALIAPDCTMSVIENYKVKEKVKLEIPLKVKAIGKCYNPNCITNTEKVKTKFKVVSKDPLKIHCEYCENVMSEII